jgi:hypothetical protein
LIIIKGQSKDGKADSRITSIKRWTKLPIMKIVTKLSTITCQAFRPSINKKSEEICSKIFSDEPVEERLIKYGLDVKNKRDFVKQ